MWTGSGLRNNKIFPSKFKKVIVNLSAMKSRWETGLPARRAGEVEDYHEEHLSPFDFVQILQRKYPRTETRLRSGWLILFITGAHPSTQ
jgi:hypothetical protein